MNWLACQTISLCLLFGCAHVVFADYVLVSNLGGNVSIIDTTTNKIISTIVLADQIRGTAVSHNGQFVYISEAFGTNVGVADRCSNTILKSILVGADPQSVAVTPDGNFAYVANLSSASVSVIDTSSHTVAATISLPHRPMEIAVAPDGKFVYIVNTFDDSVSLIEASSHTLVATIAVGASPVGLAITPNSRFAYVSNQGSNTVSVIDTSTHTVVDTIAGFFIPRGIAITPNGHCAYVANNADANVLVVDTSNNAIISAIAVGDLPYDVVITADGNFAYVANQSGSVSVIATSTNLVIDTITGFNNPGYLSITNVPAQAPVITATPPSQTIYSGETTSIELTAAVPGTTFSWTVVQNGVFGASAGSGGVIAQILSTTALNSGTAIYTITSFCDACAGAPVEVVVTVNPAATPPVAPADFVGVMEDNSLCVPTDLINVLSWTPSADPTVTSYRLYENGLPLAIVPAGGPYTVTLHNRKSQLTYTYELTAVNIHNSESAPLIVTLP